MGRGGVAASELPPPSASSFLRIFPPLVQFTDVEAGVPHSTILTVKNVDKRARTVKILNPATRFFTLQPHQPTLKLAPGLETALEVSFLSGEERNHHDALIVQTEDEKIEIPLHALAPKANVVVDANLDLGVVVADKPVSRTVTVYNTGLRPASFKFEWDTTLPVKLAPAKGSLEAGASAQVEVTVTPNELGGLGIPIELEVDDGSPRRRLELQGTVASHKFDLLWPGGGGSCKKVAFGNCFYGDEQTAEVEVFNDGPTAVRFAVKCVAHPNAESMGGVHEEDEHEEDDQDKRNVTSLLIGSRLKKFKATTVDLAVQVLQHDGDIGPYERKKIAIKFNPKREQDQKGFTATQKAASEFSKGYSFLVQVGFRGYKTQIRLPVIGRGVVPGISLQPDSLNFHSVPANDTADALLTLCNTNDEAEVSYAIERGTFFKAEPRTGVVAPGQEVSLVVTYSPKSLGKHREGLPLRIFSPSTGSLLLERLVKAVGNALEIGAKPMHATGLTAVPEDFVREKKFVDLDAPAPKSLKPTFRRPIITEKFDDFTGIPAMALTAAQTATKMAHKEKYSQFIRDARLGREEKELSKKKMKGAPDDPLSLGLESASGLRSPRLALPPATDPLYMVPADEGKTKGFVRPRNRPAYQDDEAKLGLSTFKLKPTSALEVKECSTSLLPDEISKLSIGPSVMDFGVVSAMSSTTKYFAVTNELKKSIVINVKATMHEALKGSTPETQVVPPGGTAGFGITLCVPTVQTYEETVTYFINGIHQYFFDIKAQVVPVSLNLSRDDVFFSFGPENWEPFVSEIVEVSNPNSYPAEFSWEGENAAFSISPLHGSAERNSSVPCTITWRPSSNADLNEAFFTLRIVGGTTTKKVHCVGKTPEGKCMLREKAIDLKTISVGVPQTRMFTVKNVGSSDAVYQIDTAAAPLCTVKPERGRIATGSYSEIEVCFEADQAAPINEMVAVQIRGGKTLKMPVVGEVVVPSVKMDQDEFDFGQVYIGGTQRLPCVLVNTSPIQASLTCDLSSHSAFLLDLPRDSWNPEEYDEPPLIRTSGPESPARTPDGREQNEQEEEGAKYKITLNPNSSLTIWVTFRPTMVTSHAFELPLALMGVPNADAAELRRAVIAEALRPRLLLSNTVVDFGPKIVLRERVKKIPYALDLTLQNNDSKEIEYAFGEPKNTHDGPTCPFLIDAGSRGVLGVGEAATVRCTFLPRDASSYDAIVPIYLDGASDVAYVSLDMKGQGTHPRLSFNTGEVVLPPTPLGIPSTQRFFIVNKGYDNLELQFKLPADTARLPLEVSFPEGKMIGIAKEAVPVDISFVSNKPLSFTATVEFLDDDGKRFGIPVSGTTDNCLLSLIPFLQANTGDLDLDDTEGGPVTLDTERPYVLPTFNPKASSAASSANLIRWLNTSTMKGPFSSIPGDFLGSKGRLLVEIIEFWSGKAVPGKVTKFSTNKKEAAEQVCQLFEKVLTHLKAHGALLNSVKPEFLLDAEDLNRILSSREQLLDSTVDCAENDSIHHWRELQLNYHAISSMAWRDVMMQVTRVFVLSRVTPRQFKMVPGVEEKATGTDAALVGSNMYSVSESILLKWMSYHFMKAMPTFASRVSNFDTCLRSGLVFYSLLVQHWPALETFYNALKKPAKSDEQCMENASVVLDMLKQLDLPYHITAEEIYNPQPQEMMLFSLYLYQALPQLIPKTTIEFVSVLGDSLTKHVELTNPSNKVVAYSARLEGSSDFSIESSAVTLEPKSSVSFPIICSSSTSKPISGRLILSSRKDGTAHAATLVFGLQCNVMNRTPIKVSSYESRVYEMLTSTIEVTNPFPGDCDFKIEMLSTNITPVSTAKEDAPTDKAGKKGGAAKKGRKGDGRGDVAGSDASLYPAPFGCDRRTLRMKAGERNYLNIAYLPFTLGTHICHVLFQSETFGEFVYELCGKTLLPTPSPSSKFPADVKEHTIKEIQLPFVNTQLESAKRVFLERHPGNKNKAEVEMVRNPPDMPKTVTYIVDTQSSFVSAPNTLELKHVVAKAPAKRTETNAEAGAAHGDGAAGDSNAAADGRDGGSPPPAAPAPEPAKEELVNTLIVTLAPKGPGLYPSKVVLQSPYDVRVVDLEFSAAVTGSAASLDFECAARQSITQEIPLINNSDKSLNISARFVGEGFSGPRDVTVSAHSTQQYPLTFKPAWFGDYNGSLQLTIAQTNETNTYELKGIAEEPLAEGHLVLESQARKSVARTLKVPNILGGETCKYKIFSDLPYVSGNDTLTVGAGKSSMYELTLSPQKSGTINGSLTFTAPNGQYTWFTVEMRVDKPPAEETLDVSCRVREAVVVQIFLTNPLEDSADFDVVLKGQGLLGASRLVAAGGSTQTYELLYSPLLEASGEEGSVHFVSDTLGEFWYGLNLSATASPAAEVPLMVCEVGSRTSTMLSVDNPTGEEVVLVAGSSNPRNFSVSPAHVLLPPFASAQFAVEYCPSSLAETELADVILTDPAAGTWEFKCSGHGQAPTQFDTVPITATVGQTASSMVAFVNPFRVGSTVSVRLETEEAAGVFAVMLKRHRGIGLPPFATLQIPVSFTPQKMVEHRAVLVVEMEDGLAWRYPLTGVSEAPASGSVFRYTTRARNVLEETMEVSLAGLGEVAGPEPFTFDLVTNDADRAAVRRALTMTALDDSLSSSAPLRFGVKFAPLRALSTSVGLVVTKASGGRWRFEIQLEADEPELDGTIIVESYPNSSAAVAFTHAHPEVEQKGTPFIAHFTLDSPMEFSVSPASGLMDADDETDFTVTFAPREYGKDMVGRLVIQTEEMQWLYDVRGTRPQYKVPEGQTRVDCRLSDQTQEKLAQAKARTKHNFVRANLAPVKR